MSRSTSVLLPAAEAQAAAGARDDDRTLSTRNGTWFTQDGDRSLHTAADEGDFIVDDEARKLSWVEDDDDDDDADANDGNGPRFLADMTLAEFRELQESGEILGEQPARHKKYYSAFVIACHNSSTKVRGSNERAHIAGMSICAGGRRS